MRPIRHPLSLSAPQGRLRRGRGCGREVRLRFPCLQSSCFSLLCPPLPGAHSREATAGKSGLHECLMIHLAPVSHESRVMIPGMRHRVYHMILKLLFLVLVLPLPGTLAN